MIKGGYIANKLLINKAFKEPKTIGSEAEYVAIATAQDPLCLASPLSSPLKSSGSQLLQ